MAARALERELRLDVEERRGAGAPVADPGDDERGRVDEPETADVILDDDVLSLDGDSRRDGRERLGDETIARPEDELDLRGRHDLAGAADLVAHVHAARCAGDDLESGRREQLGRQQSERTTVLDELGPTDDQRVL